MRDGRKQVKSVEITFVDDTTRTFFPPCGWFSQKSRSEFLRGGKAVKWKEYMLSWASERTTANG